MVQHGPGKRDSSRGRKTQHHPSDPRLETGEGACYRLCYRILRSGFGWNGFRRSGLLLGGRRPGLLDFTTRTARFDSYRLFHHLCNKAVSDLVNGPDKSRFVRIVPQNRSDLLDALDHRVVGDRRALPEVLNQLFLADQPVTPLDHVQQQVKGLLAKMLLQSTAFQATERRVNFHTFTTIDLAVFPRRPPASRPIVHRGRGGWDSPSHERTGQFPILATKHGTDYIATQRTWRFGTAVRERALYYSTTASINCRPLSIFNSPCVDW